MLADVVERLANSGVPVLPVRFDQLPGDIVSTADLGRKLQLPESPALVLPGLSEGRLCVLVVDQLDAVSIASGRRAELWSLFEQLLREAERFPNMSLLVGCREFDLEHDHRMRAMKADSYRFSIAKLTSLTPEQIDAAVGATEVHALLRPVLAIPLHLSMFLSLSIGDRGSVRSRDDLFERFWADKEQRVSLRLGRPSGWTQIIGQLANWLSENQQLSAPLYALDEFASTDVAAMVSEHVLGLADGRYQFFHESFFRLRVFTRFAATGRSITELLLSSEQHLFRRTEVRPSALVP